jgi:hypothetical protein
MRFVEFLRLFSDEYALFRQLAFILIKGGSDSLYQVNG